MQPAAATDAKIVFRNPNFQVHKSLLRFILPLSKFVKLPSNVGKTLVVGVIVLHPDTFSVAGAVPRLLLLQGRNGRRGVPGGEVTFGTDQTILETVARVARETTGLRVTDIVQFIQGDLWNESGELMESTTTAAEDGQVWKRYSFIVKVDFRATHDQTGESITLGEGYESWRWATQEDVRALDSGSGEGISEEMRRTMDRAFEFIQMALECIDCPRRWLALPTTPRNRVYNRPRRTPTEPPLCSFDVEQVAVWCCYYFHYDWGREMVKYTLYELVAKEGDTVQFSEHVTKTQLEFAYLGIPYTAHPLTFKGIRTTLLEKTKDNEVTVPTLESDDGLLLMDSWAIAEYLDEHYAKPAGKSLFGGSVESKALCKFAEMYVQCNVWPEIAYLLFPLIWTSLDEPSADYFLKDKWEMSLEKMQEHLRRSQDPEFIAKCANLAYRKLRPLEILLQSHKDAGRPCWMTGVGPTHADFCVFGLYSFSRLNADIVRTVWMNERVPRIQELIKGVMGLGLIKEEDLPKAITPPT